MERICLRHHWRCAMADGISPLWTWSGASESGCAIHRVEDLVGDSGATDEVIGPIQDEPTAQLAAVELH